ncbi:MAG: hypothetical protein ACR2PH_04275, partial [Desulfobulbia bacterium]
IRFVNKRMLWIIVGGTLLVFFCLLTFCLCKIASRSDRAIGLILRDGVEEPLEKRSISLREKALGPDYLNVATVSRIWQSISRKPERKKTKRLFTTNR